MEERNQTANKRVLLLPFRSGGRHNVSNSIEPLLPWLRHGNGLQLELQTKVDFSFKLLCPIPAAEDTHAEMKPSEHIRVFIC